MNPLKYLLLLLVIIISNNTNAQEYLFYCSNTTGTFQVYAKDLSTNQIFTITSNNNFNYWWVQPSPNGTELLFLRSPVGADIDDQFDYENCQMLKSNSDGSNETLILDDNAYGWNAFGNPHWHPSGNRVIMLGRPNEEFFVYTVDPDGTNPVQLTTQFSVDPNWSKSGDKIVFIGVNSDAFPTPSIADLEVFTCDYDFDNNTISNIQQLTDDNRRDHDPCFSPDGNRIAFSSADNIDLSVAHITVIDTDGSNRVDVVNDNTTNGGPVNWGANNSIYYHNVNFNVPPFTAFTAKAIDLNTNVNTDLTPSPKEGYISPYYFAAEDVNVKETLNDDLVIYPNPTNDIITFQNLSQSAKRIILTDISGREVATFMCNDNCETDISLLSSGIYFFHMFENGENVGNGKIIKSE